MFRVRLGSCQVLVLMLASVTVVQAQASEEAVNIRMWLEADGIREVQVEFNDLTLLPDAALAYLEEGAPLVLVVEAETPAGIVQEAQSLLSARGIDQVAMIMSSAADGASVRLTPGGSLVLTTEGIGGGSERADNLLSSVLPGQSVNLEVGGDVPTGVVWGATRDLAEMGARTTLVQLDPPR